MPRATGAGPTAAVVPVVKVHTLAVARKLPARSFTAVVIVAVKTVLGERLLEGVKVAVVPAYVTDPETGVGPFINVKVADVIVDESMDSLNVALTVRLIGTPASAL